MLVYQSVALLLFFFLGGEPGYKVSCIPVLLKVGPVQLVEGFHQNPQIFFSLIASGTWLHKRHTVEIPTYVSPQLQVGAPGLVLSDHE